MKHKGVLIFWAVNAILAIVFLLIAMLYGWGLRPRSWFYVILGYGLIQLQWPVYVAARILIYEKYIQPEEAKQV